jgi:prevent-host-death family protein
MALVVNMHDAKSSLSRFVNRVAAGEDVLIARHGKPIALLTRIPDRSRKRPPGLFQR